MARKAATIEYLERLVAWAGGRAQFSRLTGVQSPNLSSYLAGTKHVSWKWLESKTHQVFGVPPAFVPVLEGYDLSKRKLPTLEQVPKAPGVYALFDSAMRVLYFGKATSLYAEIRQTLKRRVAEVRPRTGSKNLTFREISVYLSAYQMNRADADFVHDIEALVLRLFVNNTFNKNGGHFRRDK